MLFPTPNPKKFEGFCWKHLRHHMEFPIETFHRELIHLIQYSKLVVAAPRYFAKSTYFSFFYPLFMALEHPGIKILLVSSTGALAEKFLGQIARELEQNQSIIRYYGFQEPKQADAKGKWCSDELHLANGSMLWAKGAEKQIRGDHPDIAIGDDLESDEMVVSPDRCKKFDHWFWTAFMGMQPQQVILVGTILHTESFLAQMINHARHGWTARMYQAIKGDGLALWPDKWPLSVLKDIELERGVYYFQQEYMNNPIPDNLRIFQEAWFREYTQLPDGLVYFTTVDPALSLEDTSDCTAIVTCGVDADRNIYVADVVNKRMLPGETVDAIFSVYERFKPATIAIETEGFQRFLKKDIEQERTVRHQYPIIREVRSGGRRKSLRIEGLQPFFESGKIYMRSDQSELRLQLLRFPSSRCHDDIIDALAYQLDIVQPASAQAESLNPDSVYASILARKRERAIGGQRYYGNGFPF